MDHLEMVEKLREKANVSYEEASAALEKCNWDLLDALLMLESEGRLYREGEATKQETFTTRTQPKAEKKANHGGFAMLLRGLAQLLRKLNAVQLLIKKNDEVQLDFSMSFVLLLALVCPWGVVIAAVVAMLFGCRFAVKGLSFDDSVNAAMDKAGDFMDDVSKAGPTVIVVESNQEDSQDK